MAIWDGECAYSLGLRRRAMTDSMECSVSVYTAAAELPPVWDEFAALRGFFVTRQYRAVLEAHGPQALQHRYALVHLHGRVVGALAVQLLDVDDELLAVRTQSRSLAMHLRNQTLGALGRRVLVCGNLFSCGMDGAVFSPEVPADQAWMLLTRALERMSVQADNVSFLLIKDLPAQANAHQRAFKAAGYAHLRVEPSMDLALVPQWRTYADYTSALNTKYRKAARVLHDAIQIAGMQLAHIADLAAHGDALHTLYTSVEQRAVMRFGAVGPGYLPALAAAMGPENFRCTGIRSGEEWVGYSAVMRDGDTAVAHMIGFETAVNARTPVYLRLLHSVIEDAIAMGCSKVHFGRTALEPKARLGAQPTPTEIWLRHCNPIVNGFVGPILRMVKQETAPQREPFRR